MARTDLPASGAACTWTPSPSRGSCGAATPANGVASPSPAKKRKNAQLGTKSPVEGSSPMPSAPSAKKRKKDGAAHPDPSHHGKGAAKLTPAKKEEKQA